MLRDPGQHLWRTDAARLLAFVVGTERRGVGGGVGGAVGGGQGGGMGVSQLVLSVLSGGSSGVAAVERYV